MENLILTPDEVKTVREALLCYKDMLVNIYVKAPALECWLTSDRDKVYALLTRIKDWQNENQ